MTGSDSSWTPKCGDSVSIIALEVEQIFQITCDCMEHKSYSKCNKRS